MNPLNRLHLFAIIQSQTSPDLSSPPAHSPPVPSGCCPPHVASRRPAAAASVEVRPGHLAMTSQEHSAQFTASGHRQLLTQKQTKGAGHHIQKTQLIHGCVKGSLSTPCPDNEDELQCGESIFRTKNLREKTSYSYMWRICKVKIANKYSNVKIFTLSTHFNQEDIQNDK